MDRRKLITIVTGILLVVLVGLGVFFALQSQQNNAPNDAKADANCNWTTTPCGSGCADNGDLYSCQAGGGTPKQPPGSGVDESCGGVGKGKTTCSGGQWKVCANGQLVNNGGGCCSGSSSITCPGTNTGGGSTTTPTTSNSCSGAGNATKCGTVGQVVPYGTNTNCTCTRTNGTLCSCVPATGSACFTVAGSASCSAVGAACGSGSTAGSCVSTGAHIGAGGIQDGINCNCVKSANTTTTPATCTSDSQCGSGKYCKNSTSCLSKLANGGRVCGGNNECLSGNCVSGTCSATASGNSPGGTASGTGTTGATCTSDTNCATGYVCQGTAGSQKCQLANNCSASNPNDTSCLCNTQGATCSDYITFTCSQLTNGQCNSNPTDGQGSPSCGQVDKVWHGGPCNRQLCGTFTIYNQCSGGGGTTTSNPPPQVNSAPYCGDAVCATNELCERTSAGSTTYKACTTTGGAPTGATVPACYGVQYNQAVQSTTCKWCGDGVFTPGTEQCDASAPNSGGNNPTQCDASCHLQNVANVCVSLTENGVDPIRSGASNFMQYTLIYQNNSTTNPFPNIRLLVSTGNTVATAVGRDANNTSSALVAPIPVGGYSYDAVTSRHTYVFRWESTSTAGVPVPDATYQVRGLTDGTDAGITTTPAACTESLTASAVAVQEPLFSIVKSSAVSCVDNSDATINYTVSVTNVGPVSGVIDFVTDTLDPLLATAGISPSNLNPSYGSYSSGVITWTGTVGDRTYTAGQTKTFTYKVVIPVGQLLNFSGGVQNLASVQYDTNTTNNNTTSFNLRTMLYCTINGIPITGIFDDGRLFLLGLILIILGFIAYRYQLGKTISEKLISGAVNTAEEFMPFEDRIERKMEKRMSKNK